jgi:hypothetical protein
MPCAQGWHRPASARPAIPVITISAPVISVSVVTVVPTGVVVIVAG